MQQDVPVYNQFGIYIGSASLLSSVGNNANDPISPSSIATGQFTAQVGLVSGYLQSSNFKAGSLGWQITAAGDCEFNSGTFRGTLSAVTGSFGNVTIATNGSLSSGQSAYDTGTGFWLGNVSGTTKVSIGNSAGNKMTWDGSSLSIVGNITATTGTIGGWTIGSTTLTGGGVTLDSSGIITGGTIRTSSGDRVQMNSATNALELYASGVQRISLGSTYLGFLNAAGTLVSTVQASSNILAVDASLTSGGSVQMNAEGSGKVSLNINSSVFFFADGPNGLNQSKTIVPLAGTNQDLGSSGSMWQNIYLRDAKQPVIYFGYVSGTTLSTSNASWTITNPSTGKYTITHNFSTTNYTATVTAVRGSGLGAYSAKVEARNTNSLQVTIFDDTGTVQASDFMFTICKI